MDRPGVVRPDWAGLGGMVDDLRAAMQNFEATRRKMLEVTATAWSDDRMVRAVVGPRGHLVGLEIDPRVFRKPNSVALSALIVATVRDATEQALARSQDVVDGSLPADLRGAMVDSADVRRLALTHDADLVVEEGEDGQLR